MVNSLDFHKKNRGKIKVISKEEITRENLHLAYTPGVGEISKAIASQKSLAGSLTGKSSTVAIVTDGSAVLGLGNIGPEAALPVMEGKAAIFASFAGINGVPICLSTQETEEIIAVVKAIAPGFGGINLEDIAAPKCFEIEKRLAQELDIPVFHDDQHGTAIVVLAGIINSLKVVDKKKSQVKVVISGAGAAGIAIAELISAYGIKNFCLCDSQGVVTAERANLSQYKLKAALESKASCPFGNCPRAVIGADILIGVSEGAQFKAHDISVMAKNPIVFALANPVPEIMPEEARKGGAVIVATGRSDFPNQINNALVFPGLFKGLLEAGIKDISPKMKTGVAEAIAQLVPNPSPENIIPSIFDKKLTQVVAEAVKKSIQSR
jgi:malate dehydrogenase (oxaloacetate-decarboxylating)